MLLGIISIVTQTNQHDESIFSSPHASHFSNEELLSSRSIRLKRQAKISPYPALPNITAEDVNFAVSRAQEIVTHRFDYFQPQIYNAGELTLANSN